jgi:hypothetical protein
MSVPAEFQTKHFPSTSQKDYYVGQLVPLRPQIVFKNTEIVYQSELRFIGIHMTETLKWCAHARVLKAKLCKVVYMVKILKETMSPYMIRIIYFSNFESCLRSCIILWGGIG